MTRVCSGCGLMFCEGECYFTEAEPEEERCKCGLVLTDGECLERCDTPEKVAERRLQYQLERELRFLRDRAA